MEPAPAELDEGAPAELAEAAPASCVLAVQAGALSTCHERQERDGTERGGSLPAKSSIG